MSHTTYFTSIVQTHPLFTFLNFDITFLIYLYCDYNCGYCMYRYMRSARKNVLGSRKTSKKCFLTNEKLVNSGEKCFVLLKNKKYFPVFPCISLLFLHTTNTTASFITITTSHIWLTPSKELVKLQLEFQVITYKSKILFNMRLSTRSHNTHSNNLSQSNMHILRFHNLFYLSFWRPLNFMCPWATWGCQVSFDTIL